MPSLRRCQNDLCFLIIMTCVIGTGILFAIWNSPRHQSSPDSSGREARIIIASAAAGHIRVHPVIPSTSPDENPPDLTTAPAGECVKHLHIFGDFSIMRHVPELSDYTYLFRNDPNATVDVNCVQEGCKCNLKLTLGANISLMQGKDAVVFGMVSTQFRGEGNALLQELIRMEPEKKQTWIYFSTEPPLRVMKWTRDINLARLKYHKIMSYDSDSDIYLPFGYYRPYDDGSKKQDDTNMVRSIYNRTGLIAWMSSNCGGFWPRMGFIEQMRELLPLDDYGGCGRKECLPKRAERCYKLMAEYKFYFALPNSECKEYISEKFWGQLFNGAVPVVAGSKKEYYEKWAPPHSFVHVGDFKTFEALAKYLKHMDENDHLYKRFHEWRTKGEVITTFPTKPTTLCQVLPHLFSGTPQEVKTLGDSPWFTGCRIAADADTFNLTRAQERARGDVTNWSVWR